MNKQIPLPLILKVAGIVFVAGTLYATFQMSNSRINKIEPAVQLHDKMLAVLETKIDNILEVVKDIKRQLK